MTDATRWVVTVKLSGVQEVCRDRAATRGGRHGPYEGAWLEVCLHLCTELLSTICNVAKTIATLQRRWTRLVASHSTIIQLVVGQVWPSERFDRLWWQQTVIGQRLQLFLCQMSPEWHYGDVSSRRCHQLSALHQRQNVRNNSGTRHSWKPAYFDRRYECDRHCMCVCILHGCIRDFKMTGRVITESGAMPLVEGPPESVNIVMFNYFFFVSGIRILQYLLWYRVTADLQFRHVGLALWFRTKSGAEHLYNRPLMSPLATPLGVRMLTGAVTCTKECFNESALLHGDS